MKTHETKENTLLQVNTISTKHQEAAYLHESFSKSVNYKRKQQFLVLGSQLLLQWVSNISKGPGF